MNFKGIIDTIKGTGKTLYSIKDMVETNPIKSMTAVLVGAGALSLLNSTVTKDSDNLNYSMNAFSRAFSLNINSIVGQGLENAQAIYIAAKDSGASLSMIQDDGLSGLKTATGLLYTGLIGEIVSHGSNYDTTKNKNEEPESIHPDEDIKKSGIGTAAAFLGFALVGLSAVAYYHFKDGTPVEIQTESQSTLPMAEAPDVTISQEHVTTEYVAPVEDVSVVVEPVVEVTPEPVVEANWWDGRAGYTPVTISAEDNLFGVELDGVKYQDNNIGYVLYDDNQNVILEQKEYTASTLHLERELQPAQYKELVAEYGSPMHVTMETIDADSARAGMDHVAVKYVGSKGVFEFESEYVEGGTLNGYIRHNL